MATLKQTAVMYHYPCPDGAFAALAAHIYFSAASLPARFFPNTVYSPIKVEELPVDQIGDAYLLDFVGPSGFVQQLSSKVDRVIILDHHKTALKMLDEGEFSGENVTKVIDMGRSGATIAYDYFMEKLSALEHGNNLRGCESGIHKFECSRKLFEYIEDADLWRWRLHNSKAFSSGLKDMNIEFNETLNPSIFQQLLSLDVEHVINQGMSSLSQKQTLINEVLDQSYEIVLDDGASGHCLAVNADAVSDLRSELGNQLAEKSRNQNLRGIGTVVYRVPELKDDQILKISLRSLDSEDTTTISQKYGGGGHRNASSFMLNCVEFEKWKVGVWKMENDCSFTKLFTFNMPEGSITKILGFRKNDELMLEIFRKEEAKQFGIYDSAIETYEPWSRNIIKFPIYGQCGSFFISSYKETLLLLDHLDSSVYDNDCEVMVLRSDMLSHH